MTDEKSTESPESGEKHQNTDRESPSREEDAHSNSASSANNSDKNTARSRSKSKKRKKTPVIRRATSLAASLFSPDPKDGDRFRWVFVFSVVAHLVIVLGVSFVLPSQAESKSITPPLRITLVTEQSADAPDSAKNLAQFDSKGEEDDAGAPLLPTSGGQPKQSQVDRERKLVEEQANAIFNADQPDKKTDPNTPDVNRDNIRNAIDIAFLNAQAKPRERFVSANARASEIAPYLENWRLLVERVGNLNYPDAAKRAKIEGNLVMDVTVNSDGSVAGVSILRSSGHKILDDGAERIVHIAAPFNVFSEEMKKDYDTLHIIRTWQFSQNTIRDVTR